MPKGSTDAKHSKEKNKPHLQIDTTETESTQDHSTQQTKNFTAHDFAHLSENEHSRYIPNSKKIGHAVIIKQPYDSVAMQYALPVVDDDETPEVRPLINIEAIQPYPGMHRYRALTPDGKTAMYAKRFVFGKSEVAGEEKSFEIACFSPSEKQGKDPFWGSIRATPLFRENLSKAVKKDLEAEMSELKQVTKGGDPLVVDHASVPARDLITTRRPDQNTVMGESARDAYENFFNLMASELSSEMKQRLKRAFETDIKSHITKNNFRPEWLHAKGWSLMPMSMDPQTQENLGAAPKWANTQMMILERVVKWFAINSPESLLTIKPKFDMLLDSELIKHIDFNVRIQIKEKFVELIQSIDPFTPYPMFAKASDLAQATAITHKILHGVDPVSTQVIGGKKSSSSSNKVVNYLKSGSSSSNQAENSVPLPSKEDGIKAVARKRHADEISSENVEQKPDPIVERKTVDVAKAKRVHVKPKFPTAQKHENSIVEVYSESFIADYDNPWRDPESMSSSGSGFVIQDQKGKKYILTNAHVAENPVFLQARLANNRLKKYEAKVKCISYQCDLALLEVEDPEFHKLTKPVELGEMVNTHQKVTVIGFPMGGTEVCVTKGIVSRIQVDTYTESGEDLLQVQVDAAINPGNSGGPAFSDGKVVGVAFQGTNRPGIGYIIPMPIVHHFLTEAFSGKVYRGFPRLPIVTEELENSNEREFYELGEKSGLRIKSIDYLSDAHTKLKKDDILLSIDGLTVTNEGTVDIPGIGKVIDYCHVTQSKFIGDTVTLKVLRKNAKGISKELDIVVELDCIAGDTEKVPVIERDKLPTFYINSGVSFVPLTRNYMEGEGSNFEEMYLVEEDCELPYAPKNNPTDQIIVINKIFKSKETEGYGKHTNTIVTEINGKSIENIHDVVAAMEGNKNKTHVITLKNKSKIILPCMSLEDLYTLLKRNHISHDRSTDLVASNNKSPKLKDKSETHKPHKKKQIVVESESDYADEAAEAEALAKKLPRTFEGLNHYKDAIDALEAKYSKAPANETVVDLNDLTEDEGDDEDYAATSEESTENVTGLSQESTEEEADEVSTKQTKKSHQTTMMAFFKPASNHHEVKPTENIIPRLNR